MADFTITVQGVPHRVRGASSRSQAEAALKQRLSQPDANEFTQKRVAQLQDMGIELDQDFATEGMTSTDKFLAGAGRSATSSVRGVRQLFNKATGDDETVAKLEQEEALARDTFAELDKGVGAEDAGELVADLAMFVGSGAGIPALMVRGAALGASKATEEGESQGANAIISGAFAGGGAAGARAAGSIFRTGARIPTAVAQGFQRLMGRGGNAGEAVGRAAAQAEVAVGSKSEAIAKVGEVGLNQLTTLVRQMNASGKDSALKGLLNTQLTRNLVQKEGRNILDINKFLASMQGMSNGQFIKAGGKYYGTQMARLRTGLEQLSKLNTMTPEAAQKALAGLIDDPVARQVGDLLGKAVEKKASPVTVKGLTEVLQGTLARTPNAAVAQGASDIQQTPPVQTARRVLSQ